MNAAYKNEFDGGEFGEGKRDKVNMGMMNGSIRHAAWRRTLEQNEGDPDCTIDQGIEGCRG